MEFKIIELEKGLEIEVRCLISDKQIGDGCSLPHIPKEITFLEVQGLPYNGSIHELCQFIDAQNGNFYDLLEIKILEMED